MGTSLAFDPDDLSLWLDLSEGLVRAAGLRALQGRKELEKLVRQVKITRDSMHWGAAGVGTCPSAAIDLDAPLQVLAVHS